MSLVRTPADVLSVAMARNGNRAGNGVLSLGVFAIALLAVSLSHADGNDSLLAVAQLSGSALRNGAPVNPPGTAMGDGDVLETGPRTTALLWLSMDDGLILDENSRLRLRSQGGSISAELERGRVAVSSPHRRLREVRLPDQAISIRSEPGARRYYQVSRLPDAAYVYARSGSVSIFDEGYAAHTEVAQGRVGRISPQAPTPAPPQQPAAPAPRLPAGAQAAGKVTAAIPKDYILRAGQQTDGKVGDDVWWNDQVRTEPRGRVRMVLTDGSILNLGSDSRLQIVQHDAQSQQTQLEMRYGRLRAQVVKLSRPDSRFEIRTNTAVCGVLGTDFYIEATEKSTRVVVFQGVVRVTPLIAGAVAGIAAGGQAGAAGAGQAGQTGVAGAGQASTSASVTVSAGQASTAVAGAASAPTAVAGAQIQAAIGATQASVSAGTTAAVAGVAATRAVVVASVAAPTAATTAIAVQVVAPPPPVSPSH